MSCSAQAFNLLGNNSDLRIYNDRLHTITGRETPIQMMEDKQTLLLLKLYNETRQTEDWMNLNWNQAFNNRNTKVRLLDVSNNKTGKNILTNRFTIINNTIEYYWLNKSWDSYKVSCKSLFLTC